MKSSLNLHWMKQPIFKQESHNQLYTMGSCVASLIFTVRNEVAKVMFLHVSVSHSVHRGVLSQHALQVVSQHALQWGGVLSSMHCRWYPLGGACSGACLIFMQFFQNTYVLQDNRLVPPPSPESTTVSVSQWHLTVDRLVMYILVCFIQNYIPATFSNAQ